MVIRSSVSTKDTIDVSSEHGIKASVEESGGVSTSVLNLSKLISVPLSLSTSYSSVVSSLSEFEHVELGMSSY